MEKILALEAYHLDLDCGEKLLIKGPMASGKTKLLNEITMQLPTHQFDFLSQTLDDNFIFGTVAENLAFNLENDAISPEKIASKIHKICEKYDVFEHLTTDIYDLTTAQKQVISLIQILIHPMTTLLLDEPLFLPTDYTGTLIVAGDFDESFFDHVICLPDPLTDSPSTDAQVTLKRDINHDKAILSVTEVVAGVSFTVYQGEKVSISTAATAPIADMIAGFAKASGEINFYYENITHQTLDKRGRKIGYVMANPNDMIFVKYVKDGLISQDILAICGLKGLEDRAINTLSFRQKKLFTTACILMQQTPIVLVDQPEFAYFQDILAYLDDKGVTVILTSASDLFTPLMDRKEVF
ncbi:ATP-binding cassette domain-containing protein [Lactococcus paracarnosus]|uniref:ABC transporter domain-containing protein n=1 Tax=Pseudolactococcus paracarnosus TaxID=2749962 RepID=A0ABT0AMA8_9LACT|nr:ATP-binding cassette domain-containing protein [Lactococcus paracarnosus]MCJ1977618.1 hypothetical protein [Lactococcus paracarnosus]MCJ1983761.1 hypothetical protein [Lactococcus paracarnosus]MCJ1998804.1 hypothetical protein [Lactococcus paracarnosus]